MIELTRQRLGRSYPVLLLLLGMGTSAAGARALGAEPPITAIAFAPDGKSVAVGSQAGLEIRSWPDLKRMRTIATELENIHDLAFAPRGDLLAAAGGSPAEAGTVELFHWPEGRLLYRVIPHDDLIYALAWRPDSGAWATASADCTVQIHEAGTGELVRTLEGHSRGVLGVCFIADGRTLVTAGIDLTVRVWDADTGKPLRSLENHTRPITGLVPRPSSQPGALPMVATISADRTVRFWQPTIGRMLRLARFESMPLCAAWTADAASLAVACADGHVRIVDPDTAEVLRDIPVLDGWAHSLALIPGKGAFLVGGQNGRLRRVDLGPKTH